MVLMSVYFCFRQIKAFVTDHSPKFEPGVAGRILTAVSNNLQWLEAPQAHLPSGSRGSSDAGSGNDIKKANQLSNNQYFANHTLSVYWKLLTRSSL